MASESTTVPAPDGTCRMVWLRSGEQAEDTMTVKGTWRLRYVPPGQKRSAPHGAARERGVRRSGGAGRRTARDLDARETTRSREGGIRGNGPRSAFPTSQLAKIDQQTHKLAHVVEHEYRFVFAVTQAGVHRLGSPTDVNVVEMIGPVPSLSCAVYAAFWP
jgi:hypothetical protein